MDKLTEERSFNGPLFVVGMPRSGTKLLRGLLNEHPRIGIPEIETDFLPVWAATWERYGDLRDPRMFDKFYGKMVNLPYFVSQAERGNLIRAEDWYNLCEDFSVSGVFEALMRHDANLEPRSPRIWGDKTPSYLNHLSLIKELFPAAKILHIVRDVRDYCVSIHKAWGKNMIRAAQRWSDDLLKIAAEKEKFGDDFLEIRYEDLLRDPRKTMMDICEFLNVEFYPGMTRLSKAQENLGDARGLRTIKEDNAGKYKSRLDHELIKKIECISRTALENYGYPIDFNSKTQRVSKPSMLFYEIADGINLTLYRFKKIGISKTLKMEFTSRFYNLFE